MSKILRIGHIVWRSTLGEKGFAHSTFTHFIAQLGIFCPISHTWPRNPHNCSNHNPCSLLTQQWPQEPQFLISSTSNHPTTKLSSIPQLVSIDQFTKPIFTSIVSYQPPTELKHIKLIKQWHSNMIPVCSAILQITQLVKSSVNHMHELYNSFNTIFHFNSTLSLPIIDSISESKHALPKIVKFVEITII